MLTLAEEVQAALHATPPAPVVALESTVITHGLPYPHNLEIARQMESEIRAVGATPATIGVLAGRMVVGLDDGQLEHLARAEHARKLSQRDLPIALASGWDGGTTVAATMAIAHAAGIQVFATGGIGGVHRGDPPVWDVSADMTALATLPVLVVCAGAKAILDVPATLEYLETLGVPVLGYQTSELPAFYSASSGLPIPARVETPAEAAAVWRVQTSGTPALPRGGLLVCAPPPAEVALPPARVEAAIARALQQASAAGVRGPAVTPFLLAAMAQETRGESIATNTALLRNNAHIAARIAVAISQPEAGPGNGDLW